MIKRYTYTACIVFTISYFTPYIPAYSADFFDDCNSNEVALILSGCTAIIEGNVLKGSELAIAYGRRSDAHLAQDAFDKAINDRKKAIEIDPSNDNLKRRLAYAYSLRGAASIEKNEIGRAIVDLEAAHQLRLYNASFKETLAKLHELKGSEQLQGAQYKKAIVSFTKAIKLGRESPFLLMNRARAYAETDDIDSAKKDYAEAIRLNPDLLEAYQRMGELFLKLGDNKTAIANFTEVLARDPKNVDALLLRALAYEPDISISNALADYKAVLKIDRKNEEAKKGIKRVQEANADAKRKTTEEAAGREAKATPELVTKPNPHTKEKPFAKMSAAELRNFLVGKIWHRGTWTSAIVEGGSMEGKFESIRFARNNSGGLVGLIAETGISVKFSVTIQSLVVHNRIHLDFTGAIRGTVQGTMQLHISPDGTLSGRAENSTRATYSDGDETFEIIFGSKYKIDVSVYNLDSPEKFPVR